MSWCPYWKSVAHKCRDWWSNSWLACLEILFPIMMVYVGAELSQKTVREKHESWNLHFCRPTLRGVWCVLWTKTKPSGSRQLHCHPNLHSSVTYFTGFISRGERANRLTSEAELGFSEASGEGGAATSQYTYKKGQKYVFSHVCMYHWPSLARRYHWGARRNSPIRSEEVHTL